MNTEKINVALRKADLDAKIAAERNADIKAVHAEVEDVAGIYTEISRLTSEQGQLIDQIDDDVKKAVDNTNQGVQSLDEARIRQENRRKNMLVFAIAAVLATIVVIGGGFLLRGLLGLSGPVGVLAGAAVMIGVLAVVGGIGYGIYSLIKCFRPKPAQPVDAPKSEHKENNKPSRTKSNANDVKADLSAGNIFSLTEAPLSTDDGIEVVKKEIATQVFKRMM